MLTVTHPSILSHFKSACQLENFILSWLDVENNVIMRSGGASSEHAMLQCSQTMLNEFRTLSTQIRMDKNQVEIDPHSPGLKESLKTVLDDILKHAKPYYSVEIHNALAQLRDKLTVETNSQNINLQQVLKDLRQGIKDTQSYQQALDPILNLISCNTSSTQSWVSSMLGSKGSKVKGNLTESTYIDLLSNNFDARVESVAQDKESTDLLFLASDKPPVRIELKHFASGSVVPSKDVQKFQRDLLKCNQHGIMISVNSQISGKENFTFELLSNSSEHCIAFYVADAGIGEHTLDKLKPALNIVYLMSQFLERNKLSGGSTMYSQDEVRRLVDTFEYWGRRVEELKHLNKRSLAMLDELQCEAALRILQNRMENKGVIERHKCEFCDIECKSKAGLKHHGRFCKKKQ